MIEVCNCAVFPVVRLDAPPAAALDTTRATPPTTATAAADAEWRSPVPAGWSGTAPTAS